MWILIFAFAVINSILIKAMKVTNMSFGCILFQVLRPICIQTLKLNVATQKPYKNQNLLYIILFIWVLMCMIITNSFSSILLRYYFKPKIIPIIESLEDVVKNENIFPLGISRIQKEAPQYLKLEKPQEFSILLERSNDTESKYNQPSPLMVVEHILSGKIVYFTNTLASNLLKANFPFAPLLNTKDKYIRNFVVYLVFKRHPFADKINSAYVSFL